MNINRELKIKQQELDLIKQLIKENPYYAGNEDLFAIVCEEVYSKSYLLFSSVKNYDYLTNYLKKIVNTSLISVLKDNSRNKSLNLKTKYMSNDDKDNDVEALNFKTDITVQRRRGVYDIYKIEDPFEENEQLFSPRKHDISKFLKLIEFVDAENADKNYIRLFALRYLQKQPTKAIALDLNISENEVMQRLLNLADIVNENIIIFK